jgi:hypothetical protein
MKFIVKQQTKTKSETEWALWNVIDLYSTEGIGH